MKSILKSKISTAVTKLSAGLAVFGLALTFAGQAWGAASCNRMLYADVVAFDMPLMWNRLGAQNINGMMYALRNDVVQMNNGILFDHDGDPGTPPLGQGLDPNNDLKPEVAGGVLTPGNVTLRPDKRPRPLVLRAGSGDCLEITLTNLLTPAANPFNAVEERSNIDFNLDINDQVAGRKVSLRFQGTQLVGDISDDGSNVGYNGSSLVDVGGSDTFTILARSDGSFVGTSYGHTFGGEGLGGTTASGLFAVLNVNAEGAGFFRSQLTNEDLLLAADANDNGVLDASEKTPQGHPIIDWQATYPNVSPWVEEGKAGLPIVNMVNGNQIVHSDLNAIIAFTGGDFTTLVAGSYGRLGHFPASTYPLESVGKRNPTVPNRLEPFREFTIAFHDEVSTKQAFPKWFEDPVLIHTFHGVRDSFMINYGSGGIGSEIIANRLGIGPMHDCVNCAYEEFFLTFHAVGEVGQLVDIPANIGLENCDPNLQNCASVGPKANYVLYPDDPSNVHHSYTGDSTAFRNVHAGPGEQHVFHLHNHQWLFNADDDNSNYLDAQGLGPGSGYAYWVNFGGSGNRNKTAGDAIFHCHFYPHFAQGMWEMWRIHDTFEPGTELVAQQSRVPFTVDGIGIGNGTPAVGARALPDGEIVAGAPTPAVVPLPGKPMAPYPADVTVVANDNQVEVCLDLGGLRVPRDGVTGACPAGTVPTFQAVGSLTSVDRTSVAGADTNLGTGDDLNPGYPFWIAGMEHTVGNRPTTPPLDMITNQQAAALQGTDPLWSHPGFAAKIGDVNVVDGWDGGLPRFAVEGYSAGGKTATAQTRLDFSKDIEAAKPVFFPEEGTDLEQVAMRFHAQRCHDTYNPDGTSAFCSGPDNTNDGLPDVGGFIANGAPPVPGAPFQEPCIDDQGRLLDGKIGNFFGGQLAEMWDTSAMTVHGRSPHDAVKPRYYKAANVQFDAVFNKLGYHFPQQRIITMWQDVVPTILQERPPEPFVFRMNTFDCAQYVHSNVVPKVYELDDYQVRTPTDIIGQHIHLPKWDLTTADGAANGWNYEDGTLSPEAVVEMIEAINHWNTDPANTPVVTRVDGQAVVSSDGNTLSPSYPELQASDHPFFGTTQFAVRWQGARSTMQRWFADPVVNVQEVDRGLGIIFTHDHYGPSTHQQIGLYSTMLIEPAGSKWVHNETGQGLNLKPDGTPFETGRIDGGPTSWQAAILTGPDADEYATYNSPDFQGVKAELVENYREFYFEYSDFQHAYQPGVYVGANDQGFALEPYGGVDLNHDGLIDNPWADYVTYVPERLPTAGANIRESFRDAIQPSFRQQAPLTAGGFPVDIWIFPPDCPVHPAPGNPGPAMAPLRPCPEAISADDVGMYVVNYRNESLAARVYDPYKTGPDGQPGTQADGKAGDLVFAMQSNVQRKIPELNDKLGLAPPGYAGGGCTGGVFCPPITDLAALSGGDPFTPTMRANDGDRVHVKMQAGGQEEEHTNLMHGLKWLQGGSGFGEAKNSGWRNAQAGGISEQFSLRTPVFADVNQRSKEADYAYSFNASLDGWVSGTWGLLRSGRDNSNNLFPLPNNDPSKAFRIANGNDFDKVCPKDAPGREYDVTAVLAEDVLPVPAGVTVQDLFPDAHEGRAPNGGTLVYNSRGDTVAATAEARGGDGPLHDPTAILYLHTMDLVADDAYLDSYKKQGKDVYFWNSSDPRCLNGSSGVQHLLRTCPVKLRPAEPYVDSNGNGQYDPGEPFTDIAWSKQATNGPNGVYDGAVAVEPIVLRSNAGDCVSVTLRNKLLEHAKTKDYGYLVYEDNGVPVFEDQPDQSKGLNADTDGDGVGDTPYARADIDFDAMPDLATGNAITGMVIRDRDHPQGMTTFNSNLMVPSATVGLHPALVEYDVTRSDGTNVGQNPSQQTAGPGEQITYMWYAGHIEAKPTTGPGNKRNVELVATPVEFGGFNLMPADKIEQGQKGLVGAGVVYPKDSTWTVDAGRTTVATVWASGIGVWDQYTNVNGINDPAVREFRDFTTVAQKAATMFYADSYPVENILGEGDFGVAEDAQDTGHMAINYGTEPLWFRFGINPTDHTGMSDEPDAHMAYSNALTGGDPETGVFTVTAGMPFRQHVLMPFAGGRGSTYDLHGHVWQRDPYVCEGYGDSAGGAPLEGKCDMGNGVPGVNGTGEVGSQRLGDNPQGMDLGGIESWFAGQHYEIVIPSAGGAGEVPGDYLYRDHMGLGNAQGLWGIVRVQ